MSKKEKIKTKSEKKPSGIKSAIKNIMALVKSGGKAELKYCVVNGNLYTLSEIEKLGYLEFSSRTKKEMPSKLYKFFPNLWTTEQGSKKPINYSHQALINNTVFMQSPEFFDDVYDSDLHIKQEEFINIRLVSYCQACSISISEKQTYGESLLELAKAFHKTVIEDKREYISTFTNLPKCEKTKFRYIIFAKAVETEILKWCLRKEKETGEEWMIAIQNVLVEEYCNHIKRLRTTFRTTCFTTSSYSQLMWGGLYGDTHRGFCVEYEIDKSDKTQDVALANLFPLIYCKSRPNMTERLANVFDGDFTFEKMWDVYFHGVLRKGIEWAQQFEWRFVLPMDNEDPSKFSQPFFKISKVYLGNRMAHKDRADIIAICKEKNIPYIGVTRAADVYQMEDCPVLCEECLHYNGGAKSTKNLDEGKGV
ncbi:MAG: DUF2971 domain-containing protein [Firmicutes bacterium]|nr:DUF2971 domain-containing protein [Bacillota bacterium]